MAIFRDARLNFKKEEEEQQERKTEGYISASSLTNSHEHNQIGGQRAPAPLAARHSCVCVFVGERGVRQRENERELICLKQCITKKENSCRVDQQFLKLLFI